VLQEGLSITAKALQHHHERMRDLATRMAKASSTHVNLNVYINPAGQPGFASHFDNHDVWVLHLRGRKRWRTYANPVVSHPVVEFGDETLEREVRPRLGTPTLETTLLPGDALYLPRGEVHDAECLEGEQCAHVSLGMYLSTFADLLADAFSWTVRGLLGSNERLGEDGAVLAHSLAGDRAKTLTGASANLAGWARAQIAQLLVVTNQSAAAAATIEAATQCRRALPYGLLVRDSDGHYTLPLEAAERHARLVDLLLMDPGREGWKWERSARDALRRLLKSRRCIEGALELRAEALAVAGRTVINSAQLYLPLHKEANEAFRGESSQSQAKRPRRPGAQAKREL
jgi:hypothetical protein